MANGKRKRFKIGKKKPDPNFSQGRTRPLISGRKLNRQEVDQIRKLYATGLPLYTQAALEAVSKILAEQDEETAEVDEAQIVGGMIFIPDHQPPEVA